MATSRAPGALAVPRAEPDLEARQRRVYTIRLPRVRVDESARASRQRFTEDLLRATAPMRAELGPSTVALSPFGGSRVAPLAELDARGLVILDLTVPGSEGQVVEALRSEALARHLQVALQRGSMSTSDVHALPLIAQVVARLGAELGVQNVHVDHFVPREVAVSDGERLLESEGDATRPVLTRLRFSQSGTKKEIVIVSTRFYADGPNASSWPTALLRQLRPQGYEWASLSADGLGLFSADPHNGLGRASQAMLDDVRPGGGVVLDYPRDANYLRGGQDFDGMRFMRGRRPLEELGLERQATLPISVGEQAFGYTGVHPDDDVRVYRKPIPHPREGSSLPLFNLEGLTSLGQGYTVRLR